MGMRGECEVDGKIEKLQGNLRDREMGNAEIHAISIRVLPLSMQTHTDLAPCPSPTHLVLMAIVRAMSSRAHAGPDRVS